MKRPSTSTVFVVLGGLTLSLGGCRSRAPAPSSIRVDKALVKLRQGDFKAAARASCPLLKRHKKSSKAAAVCALSEYMLALHNFIPWLLINIELWARKRADQGTMHRYFAALERKLAKLDPILAVAVRDPGFSLKLCLACWRRDWNHDGRITEQDEVLFQIERDADGKELPIADPRRRPTFRFDVGDVHWARAMLSFQRAVLTLIQAYRLPHPESFRDKGYFLKIHLIDKAKVHEARRLILKGLKHAEESRVAYLAETDDEAEWLPNPRQKNHPMPLPVDTQLYETWKGLVTDLSKLLRGEEGLSVEELAQLGDRKWSTPPRGFIDVGRLFSNPGDILVRRDSLERTGEDRTRDKVEGLLKELLGDKYVVSMKPSGIVKRLQRMKREVTHGKESLARKLRYLLWVN